MPKRSADSDAWLDALAGRARGPGSAGDAADADDAADAEDADDAAGIAEGRLLRGAMRRWPLPPPPPDAAAEPARLAALLAAVRADRRIAAHRGCAVCRALRRWWSWQRLAGATALAAAAMAAVVLVPRMASVTAPPVGSPDDLRGGGVEGVQRLRAADPRALRDRIANELARAGIRASRYERLGRYGLDADLPPVRSEELIRLLGRHGIALPQSGGLAVEVESAP